MSAKYTSSKKRRKQFREKRQQFLEEVQKWAPGGMDVGWLKALLVQAVEGFATEAGWRIAVQLLQEELSQRCGPRYQRCEQREASR